MAGAAFLLVVISYAGTRFALTFVRQEQLLFAGLQEAQVVAVVTAFIALAYMPMRRSASQKTVDATSD